MALITTLTENPTQVTQSQMDEIKDALVDGLLEINPSGLRIGGTSITATPAELNILDGATLTTTELNYVDGVTSAIQTQLNSKLETVSASDIATSTLVIESEGISANDNDTTIPTSAAVKDYVDTNASSLTQEEVQDFAWNVLTGTQTLITVTYQDATNDVDFVVNDDLSLYDNTTSGFISGITAEPIADLSDVTITTVADNEVLAYNSGTSTWINQTAAEAGLASASHTHTASDVTDFDTEVANNSAVSANTAKVSYPGSASATELNILDGATLTTTELNYVDGVTSAIQTQLDGKAATSHTHTHVDITDFDTEVQALSINNLSEDTTPSLGGTLDAADNDIQNIKLAEFQDEHDNGNSGTADTIDWGAGNNQKSTLTGNVTYTFTAPSGPSRLQLKIIQGAGPYTVTWPAGVTWLGSSGAAPTLSTTSGATDVVTIWYDGTEYLAVFTGED